MIPGITSGVHLSAVHPYPLSQVAHDLGGAAGEATLDAVLMVAVVVVRRSLGFPCTLTQRGLLEGETGPPKVPGRAPGSR